MNEEMNELVKQNIFNALVNTQARLFAIEAENQILRAKLAKLLAGATNAEPDLSEQQ